MSQDINLTCTSDRYRYLIKSKFYLIVHVKRGRFNSMFKKILSKLGWEIFLICWFTYSLFIGVFSFTSIRMAGWIPGFVLVAILIIFIGLDVCMEKYANYVSKRIMNNKKVFGSYNIL